LGYYCRWRSLNRRREQKISELIKLPFLYELGRKGPDFKDGKTPPHVPGFDCCPLCDYRLRQEKTHFIEIDRASRGSRGSMQFRV
jgi:hypothetical protein